MKYALALFVTAGALYAAADNQGAPRVETVCVARVQNFSHHSIPMDDVTADLAAQLRRVGFEAHEITAGLGACDAVVNTLRTVTDSESGQA